MKKILLPCTLVLAAVALPVRAAQTPMTVDDDIVILLKDMSSTAVFYPAQVGNVVVEFFAVKAPDNSVRVVVDACQSCGSAGFQQIGNDFQCTACGQLFNVTVLEQQRGGCNPIPVGVQNKRVEQDRIILPLAFLKKVAASRYAKGRIG